jgi:hypothetical protein
MSDGDLNVSGSRALTDSSIHYNAHWALTTSAHVCFEEGLLLQDAVQASSHVAANALDVIYCKGGTRPHTPIPTRARGNRFLYYRERIFKNVTKYKVDALSSVGHDNIFVILVSHVSSNGPNISTLNANRPPDTPLGAFYLKKNLFVEWYGIVF